MQRIAIVGANGFIGSRAVEVLHLNGEFDVRPLVRRIGGLALPVRFDLAVKTADATDCSTLVEAFTDCDIVLDAVLGDSHTIVESASVIYQAACQAGVRRLIYLSSQAVHGQAPLPGTTEESAISIAQPLPYNSAKVRAERRLLRQRERGSTEIVILRPGIVLGPRSRWIFGLADQLLAGTAYLIDGGTGICNSIYVDNLIEAIRLSANAASADRQVFLLGDEETATWADLYGSIAAALGFDFNRITCIAAPEFRTSLRELAEQARASDAVQSILPLVPHRLKRSVKAALWSLNQPAEQSRWSLESPARISPTLEMTLLQQCKFKLPSDKANQLLGYKPLVSFSEGCEKSIAWLKFAGYPIV
jgi:nucleoside-diphosphate-sugar epimerase